jgi:hypothetical protein
MNPLRRYIAIVAEAFERLVGEFGNRFTAYYDPSSRDVARLYDRHHNLRGLVYGDSLIVWDGEEANHELVWQELGIPRDGTISIDLYPYDHKVAISDTVMLVNPEVRTNLPAAAELLRNHPRLRACMGEFRVVSPYAQL